MNSYEASSGSDFDSDTEDSIIITTEYLGKRISCSLPVHPTYIQLVKHNICQQIIIFRSRKNLTNEVLAKKMEITIAELEDILERNYDCFTLDRLFSYIDKLFSLELDIKLESKKDHLREVRVYPYLPN